MKRLIVFGIFFIALVVISSCKKEIIKPTEGIESFEKDNRVGPNKISTSGSASGNGFGSVNEGVGGFGDITDPNDDDYTRKPKKKN